MTIAKLFALHTNAKMIQLLTIFNKLMLRLYTNFILPKTLVKNPLFMILL